MIHPDTTLRWVSDAVGFGVFATADIPRGTVTWVLDPLDQRITPTRAAQLGAPWAPVLRRFGYFDAEGNVVLSWDHARFVNHCCEPNTASGGDDRFEIALRDIRAGETMGSQRQTGPDAMAKHDAAKRFSRFQIEVGCGCRARRFPGIPLFFRTRPAT